MIHAIAFLTLQVATPTPEANANEAYTFSNQAQKFYRDCVVRAALDMERSGEKSELIVDTALSTCRGSRELAKAFSADWMKKQFPTFDQSMVDNAAAKAMTKIDDGNRADALAAVLTQRAHRN